MQLFGQLTEIDDGGNWSKECSTGFWEQSGMVQGAWLSREWQLSLNSDVTTS